jgi:hypothetical protein
VHVRSALCRLFGVRGARNCSWYLFYAEYVTLHSLYCKIMCRICHPTLSPSCKIMCRICHLTLSYRIMYRICHPTLSPSCKIMCRICHLTTQHETSICLNLVCQVQCSWFSIGVLACENLPYISQPKYKTYKISLDKLQFKCMSYDLQMMEDLWKLNKVHEQKNQHSCNL